MLGIVPKVYADLVLVSQLMCMTEGNKDKTAVKYVNAHVHVQACIHAWIGK
jgi:hypothetical protein